MAKDTFSLLASSPTPSGPTIDAKAIGTKRTFPVPSSSLCNIQITVASTSGTGTRSIWYVRGSIDGVNFVDFPSGSVTLTADDATAVQTGLLDIRLYSVIEVGLLTLSTYTTETVSFMVLRSDLPPGSSGPAGEQGAVGPSWSGGTVNSDVKLGTAGNGLYVKQGTNATFGQATLVGGTVVVPTTKVTANSAVFVTLHTLGGIAVPAAVEPTARTPGTSFTITSANVLDTSTYDWWILEPA